MQQTAKKTFMLSQAANLRFKKLEKFRFSAAQQVVKNQVKSSKASNKQ
jgi:hypothetical protein